MDSFLVPSVVQYGKVVLVIEKAILGGLVGFIPTVMAGKWFGYSSHWSRVVTLQPYMVLMIQLEN